MIKRLLIIGGYGIFGGRLAKLLENEEKLTLIIAGRSKAKATDFCRHLSSATYKEPLIFDRNKNIESQLRKIAPDIVIDATGPFQNYGADPYRIVKACLNLCIPYMDFADGADFVKNINQFDGEAKKKNIFVLSGVSSFPVLTAAVVRHLSQELCQIITITGGIAPSPYAGVGLNVIRAIASYAGQPVKLVRNGRSSVGYALTETKRYTISPPGKLPLRSIRFSLIDVPDLQVIPESYHGLHSIWVGAGPVPESLLRALNGLAWFVRLKLIPSLSPFGRFFYVVINMLRWGEHRGGMFVEVEGMMTNGEKVKKSWHLLAEGNDGPFIPAMALEALIRGCLKDRIPASGARPAIKELELADYDALFSQRTIYTGLREETFTFNAFPLYRRILGDAWDLLPTPLQTMHNLGNNLTAEGVAIIDRGTGFLSHLIATLFRFPRAGQNVPVRVHFRSEKKGERWQRTFGQRSFSSFQYEGKGRSERLLCERFGPFTFGLALVIENDKLRFSIRNWSFLGLMLPSFLKPDNNSYEFVENGVFHFHVEIGYPILGRIVRYRGQLRAYPN
jgi:hypothetical protein